MRIAILIIIPISYIILGNLFGLRLIAHVLSFYYKLLGDSSDLSIMSSGVINNDFASELCNIIFANKINVILTWPIILVLYILLMIVYVIKILIKFTIKIIIGDIFKGDRKC